MAMNEKAREVLDILLEAIKNANTAGDRLEAVTALHQFMQAMQIGVRILEEEE